MIARRQRQPPPQVLAAIAQFQRGEYFECHETLEPLWREARGEARVVYQGIIQAAVALHHAERGNRRGALTMTAKALPKLEPYTPSWRGIDVTQFIERLKAMKKGKLETSK